MSQAAEPRVSRPSTTTGARDTGWFSERWPHLFALVFGLAAAVVAVTQPWIEVTVELFGPSASAGGTSGLRVTDLAPWGALYLAGLAVAWAVTLAGVSVRAHIWRKVLATVGIVTAVGALVVLIPAWWLTEPVRTASARRVGEAARTGIDAFIFVENVGLLGAMTAATLIGAVAVATLWPTRTAAVAALLGSFAVAAAVALPWMHLYLTSADGFESRYLWWWQVSGTAAPAVVGLVALTAVAWWAALRRVGGGMVVPLAAAVLAVVVFVGGSLASVDPEDQVTAAERTRYVAIDGSVMGASFVYPTTIFLLLVALLSWRASRRSI